MTTNTQMKRMAVGCGAVLAVLAGSTIAAPHSGHGSSGHVQVGSGQADGERVVVRVVADTDDASQHNSRTVYRIDTDDEQTNIEVTSENGHTVIKLNGDLISEFDNDSWGKFEVKSSNGDVIAHVIQVPGGSVIMQPGDAMSAWNAIGGLNIDLEKLDLDALKDLGLSERFGFVTSGGSGHAPKVMLGVTMDDLSGEEAQVFGIDGGTQISVFDGSPAAIAGLHDGDVIVQIDGIGVNSDGIRTIVGGAEPGDTIRVMVRRDGHNVVVPVELSPFDGNVMEFDFDPNWFEALGEGASRIGTGPIQIGELKDIRERLAKLGQSGDVRGARGIMHMLQNDEMREARDLIAKLAQDLEHEAQRMELETGDAKAKIEQRMVELSKELSERSLEIARLSAKGAMRELRFFGEDEDGFFGGDGEGRKIIELLMPDGNRLLAEPPVPPRVGGGGDERYEALLKRFENEREARRNAEARSKELNDRLERLENRLDQLLDKLNNR